MTVQSTLNRNDYNADGVQTVYAYSFLILKDTHLKVFFDGVEQGAGFTVDGVGSPTGGNVTFSVAPTADVRVTLLREVPLTQEIDYTEYDSFPAETHESGLDLGVMADQQLAERADRSLHYDIDDTPINGAQLPKPEATKAIGYDGFGNLANLDVGIDGEPVRNPLLEDLKSGNSGFVVTDDPNGNTELGRLDSIDGTNVRLQAQTQLDIDAPATVVAGTFDAQVLTENGEDVTTESELEEARVHTGDQPPDNPTSGKLWFNSLSGRLLFYYTDPNSSQWVEIGPAPGTEQTLAPGETPPGVVAAFAGVSAPTNWVLCDGSFYDSVADPSFANLFSVISTVYGGTGPSNFAVPDLRGRAPFGKDDMGGLAAGRLGNEIDGLSLGASGGAEQHTLIEVELPSHTHGAGSLSTNTESDHNHSAGTLLVGTGGTHVHSGTSLGTSTTGSHKHDLNANENDANKGSGNNGVLARRTQGGDFMYRDSTATSHTLNSGSISNAGNHNHSITGNVGSGGSHTHTLSGSTGDAGGHSHSVTGASATAGNDTPHNNLSPAFIQNYIIKK